MKNISFLLSALILFAVSCKNQNNNVQEFKFPDINYITGLASPVKLNTDITEVNFEDYFPNIEIVDSIMIEGEKLVRILDKQKKTSINPDSLPNKLSVMKIWAGGIEYSILLKKSNKIKHKITFNPQGKKYKTVQIKGEMNAWNPANTPLVLNNGVWEAEFEAEPGKYQYLFVLDGKETLDPENTDSISNGMGGFNSLMPVGNTDNKNKLRLFTKSVGENIFYIGYNEKPEKLVVLYKNYELDERFVEKEPNGYKIIIPGDAKDQERTFIRVYACNENGFSNDLLIPIHKGQVLKDVSQIRRTDFEAAVLYNTFIDRFFDGDKTNNRPTKDKSILPKANYMGGDIAGITKKIEDGYFNELGINTIWISPIVKNPEGAYGKYPKPKTTFSAYHGYWPISFTLIDDRFGTEKEFIKLVETAHNHNLNVLLDFVANHVHETHPVYLKHKDWATDLYLPDGSLNTERWDDHRLTTWFNVFLPTLDLSKPEVYNMLSDSAVYWIEKYNLDGFRHDATKHIPEIFWQTLTKKLKNKIEVSQKRRIYQIGETYGTPELISSYVNTGQLDAQFDFNVYDAITGALANGNTFENLADVIATSQKYYGSHHLMGNITGNQDRGRFVSYAGGSLRFDEDSKLAGWTRNIDAGDPVGYKKSAILNAIITTIPGIPVIYYGDEIGMPGGNDPDNRRMMRFENLKPEEQKLKETTTKLLHIRKNSLALIYGDFRVIKAEKDIFIFERSYFDEVVYVIINNASEEKILSFEINKNISEEGFTANFGNRFLKSENKIEIKLSENSFEIIENKIYER